MQNMFSNIMPGGGGGSGGGGPNDDIPWWMKYAGKGAGIAAGIIAMLFGVMCAIGISPICIVAGIWQVVAGFIVIVLEAPFCCMFIEFVQRFSEVIESRPPWQKALLYQGLCLPPIFMCAGLSTIIGGGAIFTTSVIYGLMSLGRKASREEMAAAATAGLGKSDSTSSGLVGNIQGQDVEAAKSGGK